MKRGFIFLLLSTIAISCSFPSYIKNNTAQTTGVDFTRGKKWLLGEIDAPHEYDIKETLTKKAMEDFLKNLGDRLDYAPTAKGILISQKKIALQPDKSLLADLRRGTQCDYFINIKAAILKNDFGPVDIRPSRFNNGGTNANEVSIEIYDLDNLQIIYSQTVSATVNLPKDHQDVHFSKPSRGLILGAYKKLMKDINAKSVHQ